MNRLLTLSIAAYGLVSLAACSSDDAKVPESPDAQVPTSDAGTPDAQAPTSDAGTSDAQAPGSKAVLDLNDVRTNTDGYDFFDFKPNVKKLILAGAAETQHIAVLWYTVKDGGVALHYHAKTESVYVIDGTQTDAKGVYPTGTAYFNPPGSGHQVTNSSGFFLLAYAAPPDFASTDLIGEYTPVKIDTTAEDFTSAYPFEEKQSGVKSYTAPLDAEGGLSAEFIETTSTDAYAFKGNYLLVLKGSCDIDGVSYGKDMVAVGKSVEPLPYALSATPATEAGASTCLALGVSF
jgi:hypothetical protein